MTNIAKLLKDDPKGIKLYSPLFGEVKFKYKNDSMFVIVVEDSEECYRNFDKYGRYFTAYHNAKCLLFPSKGQTWEGWKLPSKPKFKVGDWLVYKDGGTFCGGSKIAQVQIVEKDRYIFTHGTNSNHRFIDNGCRLWSIADAKDGDVLAINWYEDGDSWEKIIIFKNYHPKGAGLFMQPCVEGYGNTFKNGNLAFREDVPYYSKTWTDNLHPATKEQRDLLFSKMKEAGYEWDADKKELRKIQPHYDIANFQLFDKVLVRNSDLGFWRGDIFSSYDDNFYCFRGTWRQCIPYERNKHLLGTTEPCDEQYVSW